VMKHRWLRRKKGTETKSVSNKWRKKSGGGKTLMGKGRAKLAGLFYRNEQQIESEQITAIPERALAAGAQLVKKKKNVALKKDLRGEAEG